MESVKCDRMKQYGGTGVVVYRVSFAGGYRVPERERYPVPIAVGYRVPTEVDVHI